MGWRNDSFGLLFRSSELKLYHTSHHSWAMKFMNFDKHDRYVYIITHQLTYMRAITGLIGKRPWNIFIICNTVASISARELAEQFPDIQVRCHREVNSRVCIIAPDTLYIGSYDFGYTRQHETVIGVRSSDACGFYLEKSFNPLWAEATPITP